LPTYPIPCTDNNDIVGAFEKKSVSFTAPDHMLKLAQPLQLGNSWTVAVLFEYPFTQEAALAGNNSYATLVSASNGDRLVAVRKEQKEGETATFVFGCYDAAKDKFYAVDFKLAALKKGWHQLRVVGTRGKTTFAVDENTIGSPLGYQTKGAAVVAVGNNIKGGEQFVTNVCEVTLYPTVAKADATIGMCACALPLCMMLIVFLLFAAFATPASYRGSYAPKAQSGSIVFKSGK
jgi:hypothetical protein